MSEDGLSARRRATALASQGVSEGTVRDVVMSRLLATGIRGTVLDFGAGRGDLTGALVGCGAFDRVVAVDLIAYPGVTEQAEWFPSDLNGALPIDSQTIDAVVAVGVVEYLENLHHVAREWFRVLHRGGVVVGTTPNNESWRAIVSFLARGQFAAFANPRYQVPLTPVTRRGLSRALGDAGFAEPAFFWSDGVLPKFTRVSWQRLSAGALGGLRFSDTLGFVAVKPDTRKS